MRVFILILTFALALLMVIFGVQNTQPVSVTFFTLTSGSTPLSLVMVVSAIVGALIVGLLWTASGVRHSIRERRLAKERKTLEARNLELEQRLAILEPKSAPAPTPVTPPAKPELPAPATP